MRPVAGCTASRIFVFTGWSRVGPHRASARHKPVAAVGAASTSHTAPPCQPFMDGSTFTALANEFSSLRARLAELELENAELRVFSKLPTGPQQHVRAVWRNREFTRYLESIGLKGKPVRSMLVTDWFKRVWFGDATHGMTRLEEAGFASIEGITVHHIVPQGLGGPDSIYNFHLVPLAVNSSFGLHFTKESVAWVGEEHAHVACEVAKFGAQRTIDEFDDSKFDPFAVRCPTTAV